MSKTNPFSYAINYQKEIAYDEAYVAYLESPAVVQMAALLEELFANEWKHWHRQGTLTRGYLGHVLAARPAAAAILGLTEEEGKALCLYLTEWEKTWEALPVEEYWRLWRLGEQINKQRPGPQAAIPGFSKELAEWEIYEETGKRGRKEALKHAKATLARHKRNAAKYSR